MNCDKCGNSLMEIFQTSIESDALLWGCPVCGYTKSRKDGPRDSLVCLVGPSGSGKTSVAYELQKRYGYNVIEGYTTRPPRYKGEKGHTFVSELEGTWNPFPWLKGKALPANVIAYTKYRDYEYWATKEQYQGKGVSLYVVDVPGVEMLRRTVRDAKIVVIALWADANSRWRRLDSRGDNHTDIVIRIAYDNQAFAIIPCDYVVDANRKFGSVVENIQGIIMPKKPTN